MFDVYRPTCSTPADRAFNQCNTQPLLHDGGGLYTLNILQPGSSVKGPDLKGFKQYVRISWSISKALDKGFQRLLRPRRVPQGNISWYKKWYEIHPSTASCRTNTTSNPCCYAETSPEEIRCQTQSEYVHFRFADHLSGSHDYKKSSQR